MGSLTLVSDTDETTAVDLTAVGTVSWHYGFGIEQAATAGTIVFNAATGSTNAGRSFSCSDGTSNFSGDTTGTYANGPGLNGTIIASTTLRKAIFYIGAVGSACTLSLSLSDSSASPLTVTTSGNACTVIVTYAANTGSQTLIWGLGDFQTLSAIALQLGTAAPAAPVAKAKPFPAAWSEDDSTPARRRVGLLSSSAPLATLPRCRRHPVEFLDEPPPTVRRPSFLPTVAAVLAMARVPTAALAATDDPLPPSRPRAVLASSAPFTTFVRSNPAAAVQAWSQDDDPIVRQRMVLSSAVAIVLAPPRRFIPAGSDDPDSPQRRPFASPFPLLQAAPVLAQGRPPVASAWTADDDVPRRANVVPPGLAPISSRPPPLATIFDDAVDWLPQPRRSLPFGTAAPAAPVARASSAAVVSWLTDEDARPPRVAALPPATPLLLSRPQAPPSAWWVDDDLPRRPPMATVPAVAVQALSRARPPGAAFLEDEVAPQQPRRVQPPPGTQAPPVFARSTPPPTAWAVEDDQRSPRLAALPPAIPTAIVAGRRVPIQFDDPDPLVQARRVQSFPGLQAAPLLARPAVPWSLWLDDDGVRPRSLALPPTLPVVTILATRRSSTQADEPEQPPQQRRSIVFPVAGSLLAKPAPMLAAWLAEDDDVPPTRRPSFVAPTSSISILAPLRAPFAVLFLEGEQPQALRVRAAPFPLLQAAPVLARAQSRVLEQAGDEETPRRLLRSALVFAPPPTLPLPSPSRGLILATWVDDQEAQRRSSAVGPLPSALVLAPASRGQGIILAWRESDDQPPTIRRAFLASTPTLPLPRARRGMWGWLEEESSPPRRIASPLAAAAAPSALLVRRVSPVQFIWWEGAEGTPWLRHSAVPLTRNHLIIARIGQRIGAATPLQPTKAKRNGST